MSNDTTTKRLEMKPLEVGVGAGAAVIAAFASSYLGTAGTLTGAALASVVGTVSTSVLRSSAARSAERVRETTARLRETRTGSMPQPTDVRPVESGSDPEGPAGTPLVGAPDPERGRRPGRKQWVMLGVGTAIAFAVALVLITGIEAAAGKPLAGLVGKQTGGGTTLGRATGADSGSSGTTPASPTATPTATSTGEPTASTTEDPSASPTPEPSATEPTPEPSATTAAPTVSAPPPTVPPSATTNPLTSESPQSTP